jgi:3-keto-5-aminohexanoate cleavage enzyme
MYYTDDSILPEYIAPLIITAAPYGPEWMPEDADIPLSWDEQVQAALDCHNAGATALHVHVRDPKPDCVTVATDTTLWSTALASHHRDSQYSTCARSGPSPASQPPRRTEPATTGT